MSNTRIIPTRAPADNPTFKIMANGNQIPNEFQVMSVVVTRAINKISYAEITLYDGNPDEEDFPISGTDHFIPNTPIEIHAGYHNNEQIIFKGIVIKHCIKVLRDNPALLIIDCKHQAIQLTKERKNTYFYDSTDSQIIEAILNNSPASSLTTEVDTTQMTHREMVQFYATDWDFIVSRAEANGKFVFTEDDKIRITAPDFRQNAALNIQYGATVLDMEAEIDSREQFESVKAFAWNAAEQSMEAVDASEPGAIAPGNLSFSDLAQTLSLGEFQIRHGGQLKDEELQAWANAQLLKSRLAKVRGRVRFQGFGDILPGQILELGGMGTRFNGQAYVSGVRHEISVTNWETDVSFGLNSEWFCRTFEDVMPMPAEGLVPGVNGLQIAVVTKLEQDPEGEFRVRVRIPMFNEEGEGFWARMALLDAGANRGTYYRPEIEDEVVIGFLNDDPRDPVILGVLHSSAKPSPITPSDDNHEKGYVSREQIKFIFNDEKKSVQLETPGGKKFLMDDDGGLVKMEDENGNKITMDSNGITIETPKKLTLKATGDIEAQGMNIQHKANAQFKASGSGGTELSSTANTVVKGAIVQIN